MADPFEVRLRFTNLLTHLSASTTSSLKTAAFALKHRDMDEDLHSCIIENLERSGATTTSSSSDAGGGGGSGGGVGGGHSSKSSSSSTAAALMNNRANIMYFLEHFCEMAIREKHEAYVEFVRRDLSKIVDSVAASGAANVKVVRRVVGTLEEKGVLSADQVAAVEENLKAKEKERGALLGDEDEDEDDNMDNNKTTAPATAAVRVTADRGSGAESKRDSAMTGMTHGTDDVEMGDAAVTASGLAPTEGDGGNSSITGAVLSKKSVTETVRSVPRSGRDAKVNGVSKADKRAIEQRIEEDRERNKRLRESVWAVTGDDEHELDKMWEEGSDLSENDFVIGVEEAEERRQFARYHQSLLQR